MMIIAPKKSGPKKVAMRNHFERTRSRYSRLMIAQSLAMAGHPRFHAKGVGADLLEENLMQRRLHHLEARDCGAGSYHPAQQLLRIGAGSELDLEIPVGVVGARHE